MQSIKIKKHSWWTSVTLIVISLWEKTRRLIPFLREPHVRVYLPRQYDNDGRTRTAVHEAGHAVVAWSAKSVRHITRIIITADREEEDLFLNAGRTKYIKKGTPWGETPHRLWEDVAIGLAGLAAESNVYDFFQPSGAEEDLGDALLAAKLIVLKERRKGKIFSPPWKKETPMRNALDLASVCYHPNELTPRLSEILNLSYYRACDIVRAERERLDALAVAVHKKGALQKKEIKTILGRRR